MSVREWFEKAKKEKFAIGAFNVGNLETFKAVAQAAANKKSPVIIESSPGETLWLGADNIVDLARNFSEDFNIPIFVNLDHGESLESCQSAIEIGYDLIHFDGSKLPFDQNLEITKQVVNLSHQKGLLVEGEMDRIEGSSEIHQEKVSETIKPSFTDPTAAKQFVESSGIDILAVSCGNIHGVFTGGGENINLEVLDQVSKSLPMTFFSLHGGSGIADEQIKAAVNFGIVKININTEIRQAFKNNLEEALKERSDEYALYKIEGPVVEAVQKLVEHKIEVFGSSGKI